MARIARSVRVSGLVQGVWFRAWTKQQADALGVAGWVRNRADGSVEAQLSGEETAVAEMIERMRRGPELARVERVEVGETADDGASGFEVRR